MYLELESVLGECLLARDERSADHQRGFACTLIVKIVFIFRSNCFGSDYFQSCMDVLLMAQDDKQSLVDMVNVIHQS